MEILNPKLERNARGYFEVRFTEKLATGYRSRTVSTRTGNPTVARDFLAEFLKQSAQQTRRAGTPTVGDLLDVYAARGLRPPQQVAIKSVRAHFGALRPGDISAQDVLNYRTQNATLTDATARNYLAFLVAALNLARRRKLISADDLPFIDLPPAGAPKTKFLDDVQSKEFLQRALDHSKTTPRLSRLTRFVFIALHTGARRNAIETLTWDRVDLTNWTIDFRLPGTPPSKKRRAMVPVADALKPVLARAYAERQTAHVLDTPGPVGREFKRWVVQDKKYAWVTPHTLRHTVATLLLRNGVSVWDVAGVLGNTPAVVSRVYGHHSPDFLRNAVNKGVSI